MGELRLRDDMPRRESTRKALAFRDQKRARRRGAGACNLHRTEVNGAELKRDTEESPGRAQVTALASRFG
ncbi:hypothetical protein GCM10010988_39080 [Cnuibacter physcomitrellae]|nr:hypothetical protein GCM10010988_39080 [Cnuibacter physcomitrellae]